MSTAGMNKRKRSLWVLVDQATRDADAGRDLDWVICWHAVRWQVRMVHYLHGHDAEPAYGAFDHHRMAEICYLVRGAIFSEILPRIKRSPIALSRGARNRELGREMHVETNAQCIRVFKALCNELKTFGLPAVQRHSRRMR